MSPCRGCSLDYFATIARFYDNNKETVEFLREHGVLPRAVKCPRCERDCSLREDGRIWRCRQSRVDPETRKRSYCGYSVSDGRGTFLQDAHLPPWKVVLFLNHWLSDHWDHNTVIKCLKISHTTSVEWRAFCSKVTDFWFQNQGRIGGPGRVVEVDTTLLGQGGAEQGESSSQAWLFGGVERDSRRRFVVPLARPQGDWQERATLLPLIKRFISAGSVVVSDQWGAYNSLEDHGYTHHVIGHSEHLVDPPDCDIHTQNIQRLWRDLKQWVRRPGIRNNQLCQYLARYLFITAHEDKDGLLHEFCVHAALLYPPQGDQCHQPPPGPAVEKSVREAARQE